MQHAGLVGEAEETRRAHTSCVTITQPFHPLCGQTFPLLSQRFAWGEERVFFPDPQTQQVRSLPLAWTNLALPDPFLVVAGGKTVLRFRDLQQLAQLLRQKQTHGKAGSLIWIST
jgi:hypothetical protein